MVTGQAALSWERANLIIQKSSFSLSQCYDKLLLDLGAQSCQQWACVLKRKGRWNAVPKEEAAALSAPPEHTLALRSAQELGFVWSKEGLQEGYHAEEDVFSAFFSSDSGTNNAKGEHLLPSTKVALNLNAQGLHLSVAQFINWSKTAAV